MLPGTDSHFIVYCNVCNTVIKQKRRKMYSVTAHASRDKHLQEQTRMHTVKQHLASIPKAFEAITVNSTAARRVLEGTQLEMNRRSQSGAVAELHGTSALLHSMSFSNGVVRVVSVPRCIAHG